MFKLPLLAIATALLVSSCATRYATLPADSGPTPDPDVLLKAMSTRLASAKQYRFTAANTIPKEVAEAQHQQPKNDVAVVVARPDKLDVKISHQGAVAREMIYDGNTFTVVDGINNFYSKAAHQGTLDTAVAQMTKIYGFQPPLAEFLLSDPYRDIKHRVAAITYLGKGEVREGGKTVLCHRIGLAGRLADAELWLGTADNLPRRLKATRSNSAGRDLLVDVDFLSWDLNPQVSGSAFRHQAPAGAVEIPMITVAEASAAPN
ncbi:MAG: DUF2092 domain-containing protein [Verrucomicrobia bacterium]|nr:DUF2092 domain-containing protein [Verrucomicrobiota bacterium]